MGRTELDGVEASSVILSASSRVWTHPENRLWRHRSRVAFHCYPVYYA